MYFKANNRYLVRIYYYRNRIALEAHHSLGDGTGGMCVLQTLTATYLRLKGHTEIENGGFVLDILETPDPVELEDAYMKYANAKVCPAQTGGEDLPCPGNQGALLYPEHHRRYYVGGRGHEGGKKL